MIARGVVIPGDRRAMYRDSERNSRREEAYLPVYRYPVPPASEITPKETILNRRAFMAGAAGLALAGSGLVGGAQSASAQERAKLTTVPSPLSTDETPNPLDDISGYCNFYEFGTGKGDPAKYAGSLTTRPWTIEVGGLVNNPGTVDIERPSLQLYAGGPDLPAALRRGMVDGRAVGRHSAGQPAVEVRRAGQRQIRRLRDAGAAGGNARPGILLQDPALALCRGAAARRGDASADDPRGRGAWRGAAEPERRAGAARRAVEIRLQEHQVDRLDPLYRRGAAGDLEFKNPREYGFYSNVNPAVDHPRWSQATERRIGGGLFAKRIDTQMFNGYADQVASLYEGMDLKANF
jgi:sulfoxide reductase catalytic subunit YedY